MTNRTPSKNSQPRTRYNSTIKCTPLKPFARSSTPKRGKPIPKVNVEKRAKRRVRQAAKHRAYMRSETRKIVDARAEGRCERVAAERYGFYRCEETTRLQHHHINYAR